LSGDERRSRSSLEVFPPFRQQEGSNPPPSCSPVGRLRRASTSNEERHDQSHPPSREGDRCAPAGDLADARSGSRDRPDQGRRQPTVSPSQPPRQEGHTLRTPNAGKSAQRDAMEPVSIASGQTVIRLAPEVGDVLGRLVRNRQDVRRCRKRSSPAVGQPEGKPCKTGRPVPRSGRD